MIIAALVVLVFAAGWYFTELYGLKKYTSADYPLPEEGEYAPLPVNINTASVDELISVDGITMKMAEDIVTYRGMTPFEFPEDIMDVPGITKKDYKLIKNLITAY